MVRVGNGNDQKGKIMIINWSEQGSEEWLESRLGVVTASNFHKVVTSTGARSKQFDEYSRRLAAEVVSGRAPETFKSEWMKRGNELEPSARLMYEFDSDCVVHETGIVYIDEKKRVGCSPDGLIEENNQIVGTLEIKCPSPWVHVEYLRKDCIPTKYIQQVQGALWVTGLEFCVFVSYCEGMPMLVKRAYPDEKMFSSFEENITLGMIKKIDELVNYIKEYK